jgi:hypothetical protein
MHPRQFTALALLFVACAGNDRPRSSSGFPEEGDSGVSGKDGSMFIDVATPDGPPSPDAAGLCGNTFFNAAPEPPNLYFVVDRSGSMLSLTGQGKTTRYEAMRIAVVDVVRTLGSRANYGVTLFPGDPLGNGCGPGTEVFPTTRGDLPGGPSNGPVTQAVAKATQSTAVGGTPTSITLSKLLPTLQALPGKTAVVLATDGGPNCNDSYACTSADCTYNIEGGFLGSHQCTPSYNCCDPSIVDGPGLYMCLDSIPTIQAVQQIRDAGIRTFVVGIPGSDYYATLLDQLATIGGSARPTSPYYYRVDDMSSLSQTLLQIGNKVLLTCQFVLEQAPPEPSFVNVYLDQSVVAYDEQNGWTWTSDTKLELHGGACQTLESGAVGQVQVVAGCPTKQPR